ncbi:MAG TPA: HD domain-containing phosphohydrolase [Aldersonia sp.]
MAPRLADLLAGLSRFADLGFGLDGGTAARSSVLAVRLAQALGLTDADARVAFYTALLHHVGCVGYAHETAQLFGDELVANVAAGRSDHASAADMFATFLPTLTRGRSPADRVRLGMALVTTGRRWGEAYTTAACEVGRDAARRLGLPTAVQDSLMHVYDLWRDQGEGIPIGAQIARLTGIAAAFDSIGGADGSLAAVRRRRGGMLTPAVVDVFLAHGRAWLGDLTRVDPTAAVLAAEPDPVVSVVDLRAVAEVFGDLVDLKSPCFLGHSRSVATLAADAARRVRLPEDACADLEIAGLLHDVGCVAISSRIWDTQARLTADDWEQVRLHPYYSERILAASTELSRLAPLVGRHHERLDGSGYHRGSTAGDLDLASRILAAAERYRTGVEPRPHRTAATADSARRALLADVDAGRLDADAARAVLAAAGDATVPEHSYSPAGLTEREVEVLRLLAHGLSNPEIGKLLVVSRRTAEHHVQHVYAEIGVSTRAAATLFAVEHGLVGRNG